LPDFPNVEHDRGQIINPDGVKNQIEGNMLSVPFTSAKVRTAIQGA
jgi:hypothetical protein